MLCQAGRAISLRCTCWRWYNLSHRLILLLAWWTIQSQRTTMPDRHRSCSASHHSLFWRFLLLTSRFWTFTWRQSRQACLYRSLFPDFGVSLSELLEVWLRSLFCSNSPGCHRWSSFLCLLHVRCRLLLIDILGRYDWWWRLGRLHVMQKVTLIVPVAHIVVAAEAPLHIWI